MDQSAIERERSLHRQAEIDDNRIRLMNYYDVMILGLTGQGKSTTADKVLIANIDGVDYRGRLPVQRPGDLCQPCQKMEEDICMWVLSNEQDSRERVATRLKNLVHFRKSDNPQKLVNDFRSAGMHVCATTLGCELLSNETSKMRILDVPGFFGAISADKLQACLNPDPSSPGIGEQASASHLGIMKDILHTQTAMSMKFRRILYFLPFRGRLEKTNSALQQELVLMFHCFGRPIFETMVIIVTLPDITYSMFPPGTPITFPQAALEETQDCFQEVLKSFIEVDMPKPPAIFISLTESCESILEKVKATRVKCDGLQLHLSRSICVRCSMKTGSLHGARVACTFGRDWSESIPFADSFCHPIMVPKYSQLDKLKERIVHTLKTVWKRGKWKWPNFSDEVCHHCKNSAGSIGCTRVGQLYTIKELARTIIVDHTHELFEDHRYLMQDLFDIESSDESDSETSVADTGNGLERNGVAAGVPSDGFTPGKQEDEHASNGFERNNISESGLSDDFTPGDQDELTPGDDTDYSVDSDINHIPVGRLHHYQRVVPVDIEYTNSIDTASDRSADESTPTVPMPMITQVYPPLQIEKLPSSIDSLSSSVEKPSSSIESLSLSVEKQSSSIEKLSSSIDSLSLSVEKQSSSIESLSLSVEKQSSSIEKLSSSVEKSETH